MFSKSAELYDKIYFEFKDYKAETQKIVEIIAREHSSARALLDVACGTGEHARILHDQHGYEVDGIDLNLIKGRPVPTFKDGAPKTTQILAMAPAIKGEEDHSGGHRLINAPLQEAKDVMGDKLVEENNIDTYGEAVLKEKQPEDKNDWLYTLYGNSAIVVFTRGDGTVFNAGTATWVRGLQENDFYTEQITRNVLNKLSR